MGGFFDLYIPGGEGLMLKFGFIVVILVFLLFIGGILKGIFMGSKGVATKFTPFALGFGIIYLIIELIQKKTRK